MIADGSGRRRRRARVSSLLAVEVAADTGELVAGVVIEAVAIVKLSRIAKLNPEVIPELNPEVIPPVPAAVGSEGVAGSRGTTIPSPMLTHAATQDTTAACTCRSARLPVMICRRGEEAGRAGMRGAGVATSID